MRCDILSTGKTLYQLIDAMKKKIRIVKHKKINQIQSNIVSVQRLADVEVFSVVVVVVDSPSMY